MPALRNHEKQTRSLRNGWRRLREEAGYSLVEVIAAIMILSIAIIPMVGMFDAGLKAATAGSRYDQARVLANANLEKVRALSYQEATTQYPPGTKDCPGGASGLDSCRVRTAYVNSSLQVVGTSQDAMQVEVIVRWDGGKEYTTTGLVARGAS
jgi:prepilin-type N-terminal cleavage/methylation domain-containing protein